MATAGEAPTGPRSGDRRTWVPYPDYPDLVWQYTHFNEPEITSKFEELAQWGTSGDTDYATLQPCTNPYEASQDRHVIHDWEIDGRIWRFRGLFDGHGGHETVDYTFQSLPSLILGRLSSRVRDKQRWEPVEITQLLGQTIVEFDNNIGQAFVDLVPGASIKELSDAQLEAIVNDPKNLEAVSRCMRGTTVLIAIVDPDSANLWVASLGDCTAILGTKNPNGSWSTQTLSFNHNGHNPAESVRVTLEHHGESGCIEDDRVLGAIAVTRAIGDFVFKLPSVYTERGLLKCHIGFRTQKKVDDLLPRVITPPYVSNVPQITHISLAASPSRSGSGNDERKDATVPGSSTSSEAASLSPPSGSSEHSPVLLLFSDGLGDLYEDEFHFTPASMAGFWSETMKYVMSSSSSNPSESSRAASSTATTGNGRPGGSHTNAAMGFIRVGLGGTDAEKVSKALTSEYSGRWMDDTTVLVTRL